MPPPELRAGRSHVPYKNGDTEALQDPLKSRLLQFPIRRPDSKQETLPGLFFVWSLAMWPKLKLRLKWSSCLSLPMCEGLDERVPLKIIAKFGGLCLSSYQQPPWIFPWTIWWVVSTFPGKTPTSEFCHRLKEVILHTETRKNPYPCED